MPSNFVLGIWVVIDCSTGLGKNLTFGYLDPEGHVAWFSVQGFSVGESFWWNISEDSNDGNRESCVRCLILRVRTYPFPRAPNHGNWLLGLDFRVRAMRFATSLIYLKPGPKL